MTRPTVLHLVPHTRVATGVTAVAVARHGRAFAHRLLSVRSLRFRLPEVRRELARADLIHSHATLAHFPDLAAELEALDAGTPLLTTVHHVDEGEGYVVDAALAADGGIHVPSRSTADAVQHRAPGTRVHELPYVPEPAPRLRRRAHHGWVVGWCGVTEHPDDRKQLGTLVAALARLDDRPTLALQGRIGGEVVDAARRAGVTVHHTPTRSWRRRWHFYAGLDAYCSPSRVEGGPLPVFEAAATGVPVVTSASGMAVRLLDAAAAWPAVPGDPEELAATLTEVRSAPAREREARQGRALAVIDDLRAERVVPRYEALYADLLGVEPPPPGPRAGQPGLERSRDLLEPAARAWRHGQARVHRLRRPQGPPRYPPARPPVRPGDGD